MRDDLRLEVNGRVGWFGTATAGGSLCASRFCRKRQPFRFAWSLGSPLRRLRWSRGLWIPFTSRASTQATRSLGRQTSRPSDTVCDGFRARKADWPRYHPHRFRRRPR